MATVWTRSLPIERYPRFAAAGEAPRPDLHRADQSRLRPGSSSRAGSHVAAAPGSERLSDEGPVGRRVGCRAAERSLGLIAWDAALHVLSPAAPGRAEEAQARQAGRQEQEGGGFGHRRRGRDIEREALVRAGSPRPFVGAGRHT